MPTVKSKNSLQGSVRRHFNRHGGKYFGTGVAAVAVSCVVGLGNMMVSSMSEAHQKHLAQIAEVARVAEDAKTALQTGVRAAFERGDDSVTYPSGETYRILSRRGPAGETVLNAHLATAMSVDGTITEIRPNPAITVVIPVPAPVAMPAP
jgi:hypothetical protein